MGILFGGFSRVILAAIFAAAQSTVSSSLNSLSTCVTSDIVAPLRKNLTDKEKLNIAKAVSWGVGIFSRRVDSRAAWVGFLISVAVAVYIGNPAGLVTKFVPGYTKPAVFELLIAFIIMASCVIPAVVASFFFGKVEEKKIAGLTYFTFRNPKATKKSKENSSSINTDEPSIKFS